MASATVAIPSTTTTTIDVEAGEGTPLLNNNTTDTVTTDDDPPPLQDIKAESLKEKAVSGVAGVNCKFFDFLFFGVFSVCVCVVFFLTYLQTLYCTRVIIIYHAYLCVFVCVCVCVCVHNYSSLAVCVSLSLLHMMFGLLYLIHILLYSSFVLFLNYVLSYLLHTTTQKQQQLVWPF